VSEHTGEVLQDLQEHLIMGEKQLGGLEDVMDL
jgi:hypothetical protein